MDDDCIPDNNFVNNHIKSLLENTNTVNCGDIFFPNDLVEASNYIRYKNSRHIPYRYESFNEKILNFQSIVTMNMSIKKSDILKNNLFFKEDFLGYGMEDNEFGCQVMDSGMVIKSCPASIQHMDIHGPFSFATKIFHTSRDGVYKLKSFNKDAAMSLRYSYFFEIDYKHNNLLIKYLIKFFRLFFTIKIAKQVLRLLNYFDGYKILYFPWLYRYIYASYYNEGIKKRIDAYKSIEEVSKNWYSDNV